VEPTRDWFDYTGFVFNALASLGTILALLYAVRADRKSDRAIKLSIEQGRRAFELEILRELFGIAERLRNLDRANGPEIYRAVSVRVLLLPSDEFTRTREVLRGSVDDLAARRRDLLKETIAAVERRMSGESGSDARMGRARYPGRRFRSAARRCLRSWRWFRLVL